MCVVDNKCNFCGRPVTPIPNALGYWCNLWCWIMDKDAGFRPTKETLDKIIEKIKDLRI